MREGDRPPFCTRPIISSLMRNSTSPLLSLPIYLLFVSSRTPLQWSSFPAASFQVRLHFFTPAITASSSSSFRRLVFLWPFAPDSRNRGNLGSFSFFVYVSTFKTPARFFFFFFLSPLHKQQYTDAQISSFP